MALFRPNCHKFCTEFKRKVMELSCTITFDAQAQGNDTYTATQEGNIVFCGLTMTLSVTAQSFYPSNSFSLL